MGDWKLCTVDMNYQSFAALSATVGNDTCKNVADGDHASVWSIAATSATLTRDPGGSYTYHGVGIGNYTNLTGWQADVYTGSTWETLVVGGVLGNGNDVVYMGAAAKSGTKIRLLVAGTNPITIGTVSFISDYGYDTTGTLQSGAGWGTLTLGDTATPGGVRYPIPFSCDAGVSSVMAAGGYIQSQVVRGRSTEIGLRLDAMQSAAGYAFDKIYRSFYPSSDNTYTNRGWAKPCWLLSDEWSSSSPAAWYVTASPGFALQYEINGRGGLTAAQLAFRTIPRTT